MLQGIKKFAPDFCVNEYMDLNIDKFRLVEKVLIFLPHETINIRKNFNKFVAKLRNQDKFAQ